MPQFKPSKEVFLSCQRDGFLIPQEEIDTVKVRHMAALAMADLVAAKALIPHTERQSIQWSTVYKLHYDALHQLAEAFARLERVKSNNHQCLFAYLCEKHPELELDWPFLEKIRTKRNGVQYYGTPATFADWKEADVPMNLSINALKKAVEERLAKTGK